MFETRIHGRGGQGVVTAAEMLSVAAFLEGRQLKGDLVFKTFYKTTLSTFIKDSGVQFFSRIRQDVSFFTFYFIMLFSLIYLLVRFKMLRGK